MLSVIFAVILCAFYIGRHWRCKLGLKKAGANMIDGEALGFDAQRRAWIVRLSDELYTNMHRTAAHLGQTKMLDEVNFTAMHGLFAVLAGMSKSELDEFILRGMRGKHGTSTENTGAGESD